MIHNHFARFMSLLLALTLLLGVAVTGCTDKDRDKDSSVASKTVYYAFDWTSPGGKAATVPNTATLLEVSAVSDEGEEVDAKLAESGIAQMDTDEDGNRLAHTIYGEDAALLVYTFYHKNGELKVVDCYADVDVANLADEATVEYSEEEHKVAVSVKVLDKDGKVATEFQSGDDINVQVYLDEANVSNMDGMKLLSDKESVVAVGKYSDEAVKCKAGDAGTANLAVEIDGFTTMNVATITVTEAPLPTKTISYSFEVEPTANAIPSTATYVTVIAWDKNYNYVDASVTESEIAKMTKQGSKYLAETEIATDANKVMYSFYHMNGELKVDDGRFAIDVAELEDGATVQQESDQTVTLSVEVYNVTGEPCTSFANGDAIYVKMYASKGETKTALAGAAGIELLSDDEETVEVGEYDATHEAIACKAGNVSKTANLAVTLGGVTTTQLVTITVTQA